MLGLFNAFALFSYASGLQRAFGKATAYWYLLFQASQFHVMYYASRTLSNMFAFGISMFRQYPFNCLYLLTKRTVSVDHLNSYLNTNFYQQR